jgi:hypothetical protein
MKVFISSLISGMEAERAAAKHVIETLGHKALMAEDLGAKASSPQVACLGLLREADLVVLILGPRYGDKQASGLSATHEEFREAQNRKPILTFVQTADAEPEQAALINEASGWERGLYRAPFATPTDLGDKISRAIYDHALANAVAPLDPTELSARALSLLPDLRRDVSGSVFILGIAAGPNQAVLRPAEIEAPALAEGLQKQALFGPSPLFDRGLGTRSRLDKGALVIYQDGQYGQTREIRLSETGDVLIQLPVDKPSSGMGFPVVIEEDIAAMLEASIGLTAWLLDQIDSTERLTHVALAARLVGSSAYGWRTRAEHAASPKSGSIMMFGREAERDAAVMLAQPYMVRQALTMNASRLVEDFIVLLRRQWKQ